MGWNDDILNATCEFVIKILIDTPIGTTITSNKRRGVFKYQVSFWKKILRNDPNWRELTAYLILEIPSIVNIVVIIVVERWTMYDIIGID